MEDASLYPSADGLYSKYIPVSFVEEMKAVTNGEIQITAYPGHALVPPPEIFKSVRNGGIQTEGDDWTISKSLCYEGTSRNGSILAAAYPRGWTDRVNIVNQFKLMLTPVIAKEDKLTARPRYAGMVAPWRCRYLCLSYHVEADHIAVESDLFIQISNDQPRVL
jgi:hypothetical protein